VSVLRPIKTVLWAFLGVRKRSEYEQDLGRAKPFRVIAVALAAVALFVGGLIALVNWIV
jgi:Protein of unknown function (DUF2970)